MNPLDIIFENDEIRIINKPYNLPTQGGQGIKNSVDSVLEAQTSEKSYPVHRLDKETSGLLIVAKNPKSANKWTNLISTKSVRKTYNALCFGKLDKNQGTINEKLDDKGKSKEAVTKFKILKTFTLQTENGEENFSLIELTLETGRMHQIRKHLAFKNCPIINDDKYGDFKKNKKIQKNGIKKMMLVAKKLNFAPELKIKDIEISYPPHFAEAVEYFSTKSYN